MERVPEPSLPKIVRTFLRTAARSVVANARYTQSAPDAGQSAHNVRPGHDTLQTPVLYNGNPVDVLIGPEGRYFTHSGIRADRFHLFAHDIWGLRSESLAEPIRKALHALQEDHAVKELDVVGTVSYTHLTLPTNREV